MHYLLLAVIYLAFISLGLPDSLLGSAWPVMHESFGVPMSYMGTVSMIISGGTILSSLMSERITKRFDTRLVTIISVVLTAAALFGFSTASAFAEICLWGIPYGIGAGAIDASLNNYVSLHYSSKHMSWLHCFWGVGTIISPCVMSSALRNSTWNSGYTTVSVIQFSIAAVLIFTAPLWSIHKKGASSEASGEIIGLRGALRIKGVPSLLIGFFAYCAAEATAMLWASSYLAGVRGVSAKTAAAFGSLFFIGITAGRFAAGFISDKLGDHKMIRLGSSIAVVGTVCVMLPLNTDTLALGGLVLIGLGCAPIYPCIIHSTPSNFGAANSQAIIGIQMASAYVGSMFMPPLFGVIAGHTTLKLMPFYILVFIALMLVMTERVFQGLSRKS